MRSNAVPSFAKRVENCGKCPRLRTYCADVAQEKRRAYRQETYWGRPVPGFGDPSAQFMIVGLAPGAHGANRTGRVFTGDRSGEWLYRALFKSGFANQSESVQRDDGLRLNNAYITCVVKCAPPQNKPLPEEEERCAEYFRHELQAFSRAKVFLALGQIAYRSLWRELGQGARPEFRHGEVLELGNGRSLILSYHPSQQNTFTGKLTEPMFDRVFEEAKRLVSS